MGAEQCVHCLELLDGMECHPLCEAMSVDGRFIFGPDGRVGLTGWRCSCGTDCELVDLADGARSCGTEQPR